MNLTKLFETQKALRDRINYNEPDRFNKLVLALLVELGECANEWRGFKFWSKDQKPRTNIPFHTISMVVETGEEISDVEYRNLLLEEYVDGLHFVLELGIELDFDYEKWEFDSWKTETISEQFLSLNLSAGEIYSDKHCGCVPDLISFYIGLGEMLGFTWDQIEDAYYEKNQINHQRQENGY